MNRRRRIGAWLAAVCAWSAASPAAVLVEDGQPRATIVVPADASPAVRAAAADLRACVETMSGAKLPVVTEAGAVNGTRIDVGPTRAARPSMPADLDGDPERVWVEARPDGITICGGSDRGTRFAVYRFLETLGCRWLAPGADHELVPRRASVEAPPARLDTKPAFGWRLFSPRTPEAEDWGLKAGMNGFYAGASAATNGGCVYWPESIHGVHAYGQVMPAKTYFAAHPEWSALRGGRRVPTDLQGGQLCVTAPGLADEFAANVLRAFREDPGAPVVSISPNDGSAWCECAACRALDRKLCGGRTTRQGLAKEQPFMGDRVFWFANEVADRVARTQPDKKLLVLAYINYAEPPDTVKPRPNVVPFLCHYAPADYSRPIADPASEANRQFDDLLRRWVKLAPDLMIYSYVSKSMWWRLPRPVMHTFAADVKYLHSLGVRRYYAQSGLSDWPLDGPLYYVIAKLLWDPAADPDALAREWTEGMFGPAAAAMTEFYAAVEASVRATGRPYSDNPRTQAAGLYDHTGLDRAMAALGRAEEASRGVEPAAGRVAEVARTFRYGYWMIEGFDQAARFEATGDPACRTAAQEAGAKALGYSRVEEAGEHVKRWTAGVALGVANTGFGKEEIRGGRTCWNADETGPGDGACGWATFVILPPRPGAAFIVEMDVWGESQLTSLSVHSGKDVWTPVRAQTPPSGKPRWETVRFPVPAAALHPDHPTQLLGFGGADRQAWISGIRAIDAPAAGGDGGGTGAPRKGGP